MKAEKKNLGILLQCDTNSLWAQPATNIKQEDARPQSLDKGAPNEQTLSQPSVACTKSETEKITIP
jgi:hypothetical protein